MAYLPQMVSKNPDFDAQGKAPPGSHYGGDYQGPVPGMIGGPDFTQSFLSDIFRVIGSLREFAPGLNKNDPLALEQLMKGNTDTGYLNIDVDRKSKKVGPLQYAGDWNSAGTGPTKDPLVQSMIGNMIQSFLSSNKSKLGEDPYGIKRQKALEKAALAMAGEQRTHQRPQSISPDSNAHGILNRFRNQDQMDRQSWRQSLRSGIH